MKQSRIGAKNTAKLLLPALVLLLASPSCGAFGLKNREVPPEASDREIIQMAQKAFNNSNFKLADYYYTVLLQRYGNNTADYIIGNYEIAHIAIRKKNYEKAVPLLNEILAIYDDTPAGYLPASYKVLAQNDLKRVPEKLRASITSSSKNNDYYENGDYGDTDFFGVPDYGGGSSSRDDYSDGGFYWY